MQNETLLKQLKSLVNVLTFKKSGGGFFPLHKFDKHQTAFLVIDILVDLLSSL